ncbi:MAG: DUF1272 domain-containing protein [Gammaproteobacteria bacterium]
MSLVMKTVCERCATALTENDIAYICSYECTFCIDCNTTLQSTCPNCGGELVLRPRRQSASDANAQEAAT